MSPASLLLATRLASNPPTLRAGWGCILCCGLVLAAWPTLLPADQPDHTLPVTLRMDRNYYTSELVGRIRLERREPSGALRATYAVRAVASPEPIRTDTFDIPIGDRYEQIVEFDVASLPNGHYSVVLQLENSDRNTLGKLRRTFIKRPPTAHEVKIDWDLNLIVNDKPFFPIATYGSKPTAGHLRSARSIGFNTIIEWPSPNEWSHKWPTRALLDEASRHDMKVIVFNTGLRNTFESHIYREEEVIRELPIKMALVESIRDHPALLAYMVADEPAGGEEDALKKISLFSNQTRIHDPYHPTWINHRWTGLDPRLASMSELAGYDVYTVPETPFSLLERRLLRGATMFKTHPLMWVQQAWCRYDARMPSQIEQRHMVYLMINRGVKGIFFYTWHGYPAIVRLHGDLVRELRQISPILLSDFPKILLPLSETLAPGHRPPPSTLLEPVGMTGSRYPADWPNISAAVWHGDPNDGKLHVIATNRNIDRRVRATFKLPDVADGQIAVINEQRTLALTDGCFSDDFDQAAVHIYEVNDDVQ